MKDYYTVTSRDSEKDGSFEGNIMYGEVEYKPCKKCGIMDRMLDGEEYCKTRKKELDNE